MDLRNGKMLWHSAAARRPLELAGERLYASAPAGPGRLRVVALDVTRKGQVVFESEPVTVPPPHPARPQSLRWTPLKEQLRLTWETADGAAPPGAVVDLRTGRVRVLSGASPDAAQKSPVDLSQRVVRWQGLVGDAYKALVLEESAAGQRLVLCGWEPGGGKPQPTRELLHGKRLVVRPAVNTPYLCLRDAVPCPDQKADERGRHGWSVFDAGTGEAVARLTYEPGTQAVAVIGPRAYCLVAGPIRCSVDRPFVNPRVLKAVDLLTGKTVWERPAEGKRLTPPGT